MEEYSITCVVVPGIQLSHSRFREGLFDDVERHATRVRRAFSVRGTLCGWRLGSLAPAGRGKKNKQTRRSSLADLHAAWHLHPWQELA